MPSTRLARMSPLFLVLCLLAAQGCKGGNEYVAPPAATVEVAKPVAQEVTEYLEFTGNTQATDSVDLRARVQGYLQKIAYKDGEVVKKDQLLFLIEQDQYEAQVREAHANLLNQQAQLQRAEIETVRAKKLFAEKAGPDTDVVKWETQRDSYKAGVEGAKAQLDLAKLNLSYTKVTAPFDGRVGRHQVDAGNLVGSGGEKTLLATIIREDPIYVYFTLSERDLLKIMRRDLKESRGDPEGRVKLQMGLGDNTAYPFPGVMDYYDLGVNAKTGTVLLRGVFPNPNGKIATGMFARVRSAVDRRKALLVPETAVGQDQGGHYVLVVNDKGVVEQKQVQISFSVDGLRVIDKGLTGDEQVIQSGLQRVRPGSPAKAEPAKPKTTPPAQPAKAAPETKQDAKPQVEPAAAPAQPEAKAAPEGTPGKPEMAPAQAGAKTAPVKTAPKKTQGAGK